MKITRFILTFSVLTLLFVFVLAGSNSRSVPVQAAPLALSGGLCNRLYLPSILNVSGIGSTAVSPTGEMAPLSNTGLYPFG
jgi:hypothetical protein